MPNPTKSQVDVTENDQNLILLIHLQVLTMGIAKGKEKRKKRERKSPNLVTPTLLNRHLLAAIPIRMMKKKREERKREKSVKGRKARK